MVHEPTTTQKILQLPPHRRWKFWSLVRMTAENECWEWRGYKSPQGYGQFYVGNNETRTASRVAWVLHHGEDPGDGLICHTCDNKSCCNPSHLYLGDKRTNALDYHERGSPNKIRGVRVHFAKLTPEDVWACRLEHYLLGTPFVELARRFGMAGWSMSAAIKGINWKHIPDPRDVARLLGLRSEQLSAARLKREGAK